MAMSRKHYDAIADAVMCATGGCASAAQRQVIAAVASAMAADNPRFDWARFMSACGADHASASAFVERGAVSVAARHRLSVMRSELGLA